MALVSGSVKVATVPLKRSPIGVTLKPVGNPADRTYEARVTEPNTGIDTDKRRVARVEYAIDHHQQPGDSNWQSLTATSPGVYRFTLPD